MQSHLWQQLPRLSHCVGINSYTEGAMDRLKAPYPWFGGKSKVAARVWDLVGDVDNAIEPFAGSAAWMLTRPHPPRIETLNDADCYVANFWRATAHDPEAVVEHADGPVNEADLHARHRWLVLSGAAAEFRQRMRTDPDYYHPRIAGWWCWGLCCWIGSGWCVSPNTADWDQIPKLSSNASGGDGIHAKGPSDTNRPQLADARARGRGVHNDNHLSQQLPRLGARYDMADLPGVLNPIVGGTCAQRRAWLLDWFSRLRDRLRTVRVCCGDWRRVCDSDSVLTRLGTTGVFLDPPYGEAAGRASNLYSTDSLTVAADVRSWCLEHGNNRQMRIVLAGYAGEGHEALEEAGWKVEAWKADGGYGNRSDKGKANAAKERLWISPHCHHQKTLFD